MTTPFDFSCGVAGDPNRFLGGEPRIVFLDDDGDLEEQIFDLVESMAAWLFDDELDRAVTDLTADGGATLTIHECGEEGGDLVATLKVAHFVDPRQLCFD